MTDNENTPRTDTDQLDTTLQVLDETAPQKIAAEEIKIEPTLVGYFIEKRASPSAYFKVLRKNEVKRFQHSDRVAAETLMASEDPDGERLWALMAHSSLPDSVDAWVWGAALARLKEYFGDAFDPGEHNTRRILKKIVIKHKPAFASEKNEAKKRAETWFRIAVCWLMEKRNLSAWQAAADLQHVFNLTSSLAKVAIQKGKSRELQIAVAMSGLGDEMVEAAEKDRDREKSISADLRYSLQVARTESEKLQSELVSARQTRAKQEKHVSELEQTLSNERQHWGHDLTETKAEQKVLLGGRIGPLLKDAIDALEIDPPEPGIALRRVRAAVSVIEEVKE